MLPPRSLAAAVILPTLILAASACASRPAAAPLSSPPPEPSSRTVRALFEGAPCSLTIAFEGNRRIPSSVLFPLLQTPTSVELTDDIVTRDVLFLESHYYDQGYLSVSVTPEQTARGDAVSLRFLVHEGPRYTLARFEVFEKDDAARLPLVAGWKSSLALHQIFSRRDLMLELEWLERIYQDLGYADVTVVPDTDLDEGKREVSLQVPVIRGPLSAFGQVHFDGLRTLRAEDLVGSLGFSPGERYSTRALVHAKKRLLGRDLFHSVDVGISHEGHPGIVDVTFTVEERPRRPASPALTSAP